MNGVEYVGHDLFLTWEPDQLGGKEGGGDGQNQGFVAMNLAEIDCDRSSNVERFAIINEDITFFPHVFRLALEG